MWPDCGWNGVNSICLATFSVSVSTCWWQDPYLEALERISFQSQVVLADFTLVKYAMTWRLNCQCPPCPGHSRALGTQPRCMETTLPRAAWEVINRGGLCRDLEWIPHNPSQGALVKEGRRKGNLSLAQLAAALVAVNLTNIAPLTKEHCGHQEDLGILMLNATYCLSGRDPEPGNCCLKASLPHCPFQSNTWLYRKTAR